LRTLILGARRELATSRVDGTRGFDPTSDMNGCSGNMKFPNTVS
jgi:hypothetical protein